MFLAGHAGFAMATHYCGGLAVEMQFVVGQAELDCGMANMETSCRGYAAKDNQIDKKPCCENEYQSLDVDDELKTQNIDSSINLDFVATLFIMLAGRNYASENDNAKYLNYSPPLIERNIPVLVQSFLL